MLWTLLKRDLGLALFHQQAVWYPSLFCLIILVLYPFVIGSNINLLQQIMPGIFWLTCLLASMLTLSLLFEEDYHDGSLEYYVSLDLWLGWVVISKWISHWLVTFVPLLIMVSLAGFFFSLSLAVMLKIAVALMLATPTLSAVGLLASSLALGSTRTHIIVTLITLPFTIPILICGTIASMEGEISINSIALSLLISMLCFMTPLALGAASWSLRHAIIYR
jgi:heme exporter protein B